MSQGHKCVRTGGLSEDDLEGSEGRRSGQRPDGESL